MHCLIKIFFFFKNCSFFDFYITNLGVFLVSFNASLNLSNSTFQNISLNNGSQFFQVSESFFKIDEIFVNEILGQNDFSSFFYSNLTNLQITSSNFINISFLTIFQWYNPSLMQNTSNFSMINCYFSNIFNGNLHIFDFEETFYNFSSMGNKFENITTNANIFNFFAAQNIIEFKNTDFLRNFAKNNIYSSFAISLNLTNVSCISNNNRKSGNFSLGQACFCTENTVFRFIFKLKIIHCFSNLTAPGLIINDNANFQQNRVFSSFYTINISNSSFFSNYAFFSSKIINQGGSVFIDSMAYVFVDFCFFKQNMIVLAISNQNSIGGPCMTVMNSNYFYISRSFFKFNKSTKMSNCLVIFSMECELVKNVFINNTIASLNPQFVQFKRITRLFFDSLVTPDSFSSQSDGGGLYFSGSILSVSFCYFYGNNAVSGGAIFIDEDNAFLLEMISKVEHCIFSFNDAMQDGGVFYLSNPSKKISLHVINCFFTYNYGYNGGVLNTYYLTTLYVEQNVFFNNTSNCSPIFFFSSSFCTLFSAYNLILKNFPLATAILTGGSYVTSLAVSTKITMSHERFVDNACYDGVLAVFRTILMDDNSLYLRNIGTKLSGFAIFANSEIFLNSSLILHSHGGGMGFLIIGDYSNIKIDGAFVKNISSDSHGTFVFLLWFATMTVQNSFIFENIDTSASFFYFVEGGKSEMIIDKCRFYENSFLYTMLDIYASNFVLIRSTFINNSGQLFLLQYASFVVIDSNSFHNINSDFYEIASIHFCTVFNFTNNNLSYLNSFSDIGGFCVGENSTISFENSRILKINVKKLASFLFTIFCDVQFFSLDFISHDFNAFYLQFTNLTLSNCFFNNLNPYEPFEASGENYNQYGTFIIQDFRNVSIFNSIFLNNVDMMYAGAIYASMTTPKDCIFKILNSSFVNQKAIKSGGVIFGMNIKILIYHSVFKNNSAERGGVLCFYTDSGDFFLFFE